MSYEPQHLLEVRNLALAPNKQAALQVPVALASYTQRPRLPGTSFAQIQKQYFSDEQLANKGHQWPTLKVPTQYTTAFDATWDLDSFVAGWLMAFSMGSVVVSGAGPFTHVFKFIQSSNQMPVTSVLFQDTNDIFYQMPDLAISDLVITGKDTGTAQAQFKMVGTGKYVDGAVPLPPITVPQYLLASDTDILIGVPSPQIAPVLAPVVNGALAGATYFVRITYTTAAGETLAGPESSIVVPANSVPQVISPAAMLGATGWNAYISTATGAETKQNVAPNAIGAPFQLPAAGLIAGTALPLATTALSSIKERVREWQVHLAMDMSPHRAPGGGLFATFMKVLKQRATCTLQVAAKDVDDMRSLFINDTLRELQININSGPSQQLLMKFPGIFFTTQLSAQGVELTWQLTAGDQDVIKNGVNEVFQATVINNVPAYMIAA
ncbi:MAG TPA: hypothetical protein VKZ53_13115 [Candidatus Angelobacter sp.]|nr:hypothetical protein [Candidatus Angelobacter sp.]